tara:strand:+ start:889 stop:1053 length:165 start_codon:yes stop_codon:yes gene_type:complete
MGLTQEAMAQKLGYSSGVRISEIESGSMEMSSIAKKCLEYLDELNKGEAIENNK